MTLKEELEILRGEPIAVNAGDPRDIPANETSDPARLCAAPVVSVHMMAYNHEPYIRQAIEGVMAQRTDFPFELVIGEDCSTDRTREICFECQRLHPDRIRVLWGDRNLHREPHPAGGNLWRIFAHCRGEFIAFCEGDDYWTDPLKLQKQVDAMRRHPNVGFSFCGAQILDQATGRFARWNDRLDGFRPGLLPSKRYALWTMFGRDPLYPWGPEFWQMTATFLFRREIWERARRQFDILSWRLSVADVLMCLGCGLLSDAYYLEDDVAVYRRTSTGLTVASGGRCLVDTLLARLYFARTAFGLGLDDIPDTFVEALVDGFCGYRFPADGPDRARARLAAWSVHPETASLLKRPCLVLQRAAGFDPDAPVADERLVRYRQYVGYSIPRKLFRLLASVADERGFRRNSRRREAGLGALIGYLLKRK